MSEEIGWDILSVQGILPMNLREGGYRSVLRVSDLMQYMRLADWWSTTGSMYEESRPPGYPYVSNQAVFLFSNLFIENKSGEAPERTFTKEAAKRQNGGSNEITVSGRRIEKQRLLP